MEFAVTLATPADDPAIRRLLRENPVPGAIALSFEREPDYFLGCAPMGRSVQVLVARHLPTGDVAGICCRAIQHRYVNGVPQAIGYLGELRVDPRYRGRWLVSQGMRAIHELHADGQVSAYLATITEGNSEAEGVLVDRARRHFPAFRPVDRLHTLALMLRRRRPHSHGVDAATAQDLPAVLAFLNRCGPEKQFFPVMEAADFNQPGLTIGDLLLVREQGEIRGCVALWDQSSFKQSRVRGYGGALGWGRPLYNAGARLLGYQPLPAPGESLRNAYATCLCVAGNDPEVFRRLLGALYDKAAGLGYAYLTLGLFEGDPLLPVANRFPHITYRSRLYTACWEDGGTFHDRLDQRIPYLDIAAL
ncbi:MAG: hypothetical protein ACM3XM_07430 [Mycobacterium leprae]